MNINVEFKNLADDEKLRRRIGKFVKALERRLPHDKDDEVFLRALLEENAVRKLYRVSITLTVPKKTLASQEERHDLDAAIRDSFAEIERQIEAYKSTQRGDYVWKRRARREELRKHK